ncbi:hypothetical protein HMPREF1580_00906 [Gardnerella vaginalis JCP8070]|nr:hypothetical protein HMPREF1580_00906 [Gardnerella vaginalis JCP8070]
MGSFCILLKNCTYLVVCSFVCRFVCRFVFFEFLSFYNHRKMFTFVF